MSLPVENHSPHAYLYHLPFGVVAVAHHQSPAVLIDLVGKRLDRGDDPGQQRRRSICRAPSRTLSSSSDELGVFSLDASASWTTLRISASSRTGAPTPVLIGVL